MHPFARQHTTLHICTTSKTPVSLQTPVELVRKPQIEGKNQQKKKKEKEESVFLYCSKEIGQSQG